MQIDNGYDVYRQLKAKVEQAKITLGYDFTRIPSLNPAPAKIDGRDSSGIQTVCTVLKDQVRCKHYVKSRYRDCCMYQAGSLFCDKCPGLN